MKVTPATIATRSHQSATQLFARELRTWRRRISYFAFTAQAAARRGEWNDVAAVLDWLGNAELSCRPINPYGPRRRGEPHNLSLFALLTLFDIACHAARNLQHLSDYNKNSFRMSDLNCRTVRRKPSFCPRARDHPVGFGYRNYFAVVNHGRHGAACSQVIVEVVIKITSVELSQRI
jgi:hypothetical protein